MITMRDGGSVNLNSIISHFNECGGKMVLGANKAKLANHDKHLSLDYWLRSNGARNPDQMQAESSLIEQLVGTGNFAETVMACPNTGRQCKALKLLRISR